MLQLLRRFHLLVRPRQVLLLLLLLLLGSKSKTRKGWVCGSSTTTVFVVHDHHHHRRRRRSGCASPPPSSSRRWPLAPARPTAVDDGRMAAMQCSGWMDGWTLRRQRRTDGRHHHHGGATNDERREQCVPFTTVRTTTGRERECGWKEEELRTTTKCKQQRSTQ